VKFCVEKATVIDISKGAVFQQDEFDAWLSLTSDPNQNFPSGLSNANQGFVKPTFAQNR